MISWHRPSAEDSRQLDPESVFDAGLRHHHISNTAYPIAHNRTWKPYKLSRKHYSDAITRAFAPILELGLYAHIPFCETRCSFCEYTVVGKKELHLTQEYMKWLASELRLYRELLDTPSRTLLGFDIGGGTPSFVEAEYITELVDQVRESFAIAPGMEISIETTPKIAASRPDKIKSYKQCGIDRISMGVQVIQPDLLRILNRSENGLQHHHRAVEHMRQAGFRKLNLDLMYGFADQSLDSWEATLRHAIELGPDYITLYRMRYKLTRISHQAPRVLLDNVREQSTLAREILGAAGYFANPGKNTFSSSADHPGTSDYLTRRVIEGMPYLGIGLGAQSMTHTTISYNDGAVGKSFAPYERSVRKGEIPIQDLYELPLCHMAAKMCAVSFYFGEINLHAFQSKFGIPLETIYKREVQYLLEHGLMHYTESAFSLTEKGAKNFPGVIALFFAPSVKQYLIETDASQNQDSERNLKLALRVAEENAA